MRRKNKNKSDCMGTAVILAIDFIAALTLVATLFRLP